MKKELLHVRDRSAPNYQSKMTDYNEETNNSCFPAQQNKHLCTKLTKNESESQGFCAIVSR